MEGLLLFNCVVPSSTGELLDIPVNRQCSSRAFLAIERMAVNSASVLDVGFSSASALQLLLRLLLLGELDVSHNLP